MKKRLALSFLGIMMMAMLASCTKEEMPAIYKPIDYVSLRAAEYRLQDNVALYVRYSISNQSNKTLYYCKFRATQCMESGTEYYSQIYEVGSKEDMTVWTLAPGDINYTPYYNVHFVHDNNGHIKGDIIDAKFY